MDTGTCLIGLQAFLQGNTKKREEEYIVSYRMAIKEERR